MKTTNTKQRLPKDKQAKLKLYGKHSNKPRLYLKSCIHQQIS